MKRRVGLALLFAIAMIGAINLADPQILRALGWWLTLEGRQWTFDPNNTGIAYSMSQYDGNDQLIVIPDRQWIGSMGFRFIRNGNQVLGIQGHSGSVFKTLDDKLYFASFPAGSSGCTVYAYDLLDGRLLWQTRLLAVGDPAHSAYGNSVNLEIGESVPQNADGRGIIEIDGKESYGEYSEILDLKTGKLLAHKIYRQGF